MFKLNFCYVYVSVFHYVNRFPPSLSPDPLLSAPLTLLLSQLSPLTPPLPTQQSQGAMELELSDTTVKLLRLLANLSIEQSIGELLAATPEAIQVIIVLCCVVLCCGVSNSFELCSIILIVSSFVVCTSKNDELHFPPRC
jgi:hypothetical protein